MAYRFTGGAQQGQPLLTQSTLDLIGSCGSHPICSFNFPAEPTLTLWPAGLWQKARHQEERTRSRCNDSEWIMVSFSRGLSRLAHIRGSLVPVFTYALRLRTSGDPRPPGLRPLTHMIETIRPPAQQKALHFHFNYRCWWWNTDRAMTLAALLISGNRCFQLIMLAGVTTRQSLHQSNYYS